MPNINFDYEKFFLLLQFKKGYDNITESCWLVILKGCRQKGQDDWQSQNIK